MEAHFRNLERHYHQAQINQKLYPNTRLHVSDGEARITLPVEPSQFHGMNAVHGSVYFKLLDDASYFAVNAKVQDVWVVTTSFQIQLTRPISSGVMTCHGRLKSMSRQWFFAEASLVDDKGRALAFGSGQFVKTSNPIEKPS
jgi:uncharacterized protein (TIGR00369 family)